MFPLCFLPSEICTPHCPSPAAHQCHDTFVRPIKAVGLQPSQATSFLLNAPPTSLTNLQQQRPNFVSLRHSTLDKSVGFIMLGHVLLSVRTLPLSAVDRPSRKHCCQSHKPAVSISPKPLSVCKQQEELQLPLTRTGSPGPGGESLSPHLGQDGGPSPTASLLEDEQLLRRLLHTATSGRQPQPPRQRLFWLVRSKDTQRGVAVHHGWTLFLEECVLGLNNL